MTLLLLAACSEQGLEGIRIDDVAVVLGDFDDMTTTLTGLDVPTTPFDGFTVQATYQPEDERQKRDDGLPSFEGLLTDADEKGRLAIQLYGAVFVNSGARGLGVGQYNNLLLEDDGIVGDEELVGRVCSYVESGGTLVASDWAYDLVERCWPDAVEFAGDDEAIDGAQLGVADGGVTATVHEETLKEGLGATVAIAYDYSAWAAIESVGADTEVLLSGTVEYQPSSDAGYETLSDAPLFVRFPAGSGQVVFSTFHLAAQTKLLSEGLVLYGVEGIDALVGEAAE
ncbi:MAG: hypothetical protein ACOZNI_02150 [Myxococcota bacterium]